MSYSINLYLDKAISEKQQRLIREAGSKEEIKALENQIENNNLQIFIYLRFKGTTIKVYADRKCTQAQWDSEKQRVNPRVYKGGAPELNTYLSKLVNQISKIHEDNIEKGKITSNEEIKILVDELNERVEKGTPLITIQKAFEQYCQIAKTEKATNTLKKYTGTWNHLLAYTSKKRIKLSFQLFDADFEYKFKHYLVNERDSIMNDNTIAKNFKTLKAFLRFCEERSYHKYTAYQKYKAFEREGEIYVLSIEELMRLYNFNFENESHSRIRDAFCFMCFTGLRYIDVANLKRYHIRKGLLDLNIKKTEAHAVIPLNPYAIKILEKYKDEKKPLPVISNQKMNDALKEIGKIVGFTDYVKIKSWVNNKLYESLCPKYEVLTCHVGRKTFTTNSLILGMTESETKAITGHKSDKDFRRYVRIADEHKQKALNRAWSEESIKKLC